MSRFHVTLANLVQCRRAVVRVGRLRGGDTDFDDNSIELVAKVVAGPKGMMGRRVSLCTSVQELVDQLPEEFARNLLAGLLEQHPEPPPLGILPSTQE